METSSSAARKKTGFKGKRASRKFGCHGRHGGCGNQRYTNQQPTYSGPSADQLTLMDIVPLHHDRSASRKETKADLAKKLRSAS
jgi:hypothetical protein